MLFELMLTTYLYPIRTKHFVSMNAGNENDKKAKDGTPVSSEMFDFNLDEININLDISQTEVARENKRAEPVVNEDNLSPIMCKSPQPRTLFFEEGIGTLSDNLSDKVSCKRVANFTPRQNLKRVEMLHSISSVTVGDNFACNGLISTPMCSSHMKVRNHLMEQFGDLAAPDSVESLVIELETTIFLKGGTDMSS